MTVDALISYFYDIIGGTALAPMQVGVPSEEASRKSSPVHAVSVQEELGRKEKHMEAIKGRRESSSESNPDALKGLKSKDYRPARSRESFSREVGCAGV